MREPELIIIPGILRLIAEIDEFKWAAFPRSHAERGNEEVKISKKVVKLI